MIKFLDSKENRLEILNLEDNKIGSHTVNSLLEVLCNSSFLRVLNLSKNYVTDSCGDNLK